MRVWQRLQHGNLGYFRKHSSRCAEWIAAQEVVAPTVAPAAARAPTGGQEEPRVKTAEKL